MREKFVVMWQSHKKTQKPGVLNWLLGKKERHLEPILFQYDDSEVAEYGYNNIRNNGGYRPMLMKVIKE